MIDLREKLREIGGGYEFLSYFLPNIYSATTIKDFLDNKEFIKPTKTLLPMGVFFYNLAGIDLESSVIFNEVEEGIGMLSDLNSSFLFPFLDEFLEERKKRPISDGDRIYQVSLDYCPEKDLISVVSYKTQGPLSIEREPKTELEENLGLGFLKI